MADIGEFASRAADRYLEYQETAQLRFNLGLDRPAVEDLVKAVFYASMIPDEGRWPSVCLMCYRKERESGFHFLFNPRREVTAQEIAKLAHATAADGHICCVSDDGKLSIVGMHVTVLNEMRELGYNSSRVANPLKVVIRGPGHIEVSATGLALAYKAGEVTDEAPLQYCDVMTALTEVVGEELSELTSGTVEALDDIFNDLAKAIVRLGHGGMLIFAKEPRASQFDPFRRLDCLLLQQLLIRYWNDVACLLDELGGVDNVLNNEVRRTASRFALVVSSTTSMLEKCIGSIAHLAGVDGAIVLDYACQVVAFNAITAKSIEVPVASRLVDRDGAALERSDLFGHRGSRHQSALFYATHVSDSFVFVISQDGGVTGFHNRGDGTVVCEPGLRVLD